jgi:hypothetical protein
LTRSSQVRMPFGLPSRTMKTTCDVDTSSPGAGSTMPASSRRVWSGSTEKTRRRLLARLDGAALVARGAERPMRNAVPRPASVCS